MIFAKQTNIIEVITAILIFSPSYIKAGFTSVDFAFIGWGEQSDELKIETPIWVDVNNTPDVSTDDQIESTPGGPSQIMIDQHDQIYVSSYNLNYLKVFDSLGRLITNLSYETPVYSDLIGSGSISTFYVDSLSRIFLLTFPPSERLFVIDTLCNLVDTLNPLGWNTGIGLCAMFENSNNEFSVCACNGEMYTYHDSGFTAGGGMGKIALDGYYYNAGFEDSTTIRLIRYSNPGLSGYASDLQETFISYLPSMLSCGLLGVDDQMRLFLSIFDSELRTRIRVYNTSYELVDELVFPAASNKYYRFTGSLLRSDGSIFELRYMDDGLHIVKWLEQ